MSASKKSPRKGWPGKPARKGSGDRLPDIDAIFDTFLNAYVLVFVACRTMEEGEEEDYGPALLVLRQGVDALEEFSDKFERADLKIKALRKGDAKVTGGAA